MKTTVVQKGSNKPMSVMKLTQMAMLIAISVVLVLLIKFPIFPSASFLEYDMADVPVLIGTMMFGAPAGMVILLITSVIQAFLLGGNGWVGLLMHFLASGALVVISGGIYGHFKSFKSLVIGLALGTVAMAAVMVPLNLIFTVNFFHVPYDAVMDLMIPVIIPFNLIKAGVNSIITVIVFMSLKKILKR